MASFVESWLVGPQSTQFYTRYYKATTRSPLAHLVFLHGFIEHIARYEATHSAFAARGVSVFAFDQRGFGRTALDVEHRSKNSAYGRTNWAAHLEDVEWFVKRASEQAEGVPVFLMGHSMGGSLALSFVTRANPPPEKATVALLAGVISTGPLIQQTTPASKFTLWLGGKAAKLTPYAMISTPVKSEELSHDKAVNAAYMQDPLIQHRGSMRGVSDMLDAGGELLRSGYQRWPKQLPLLLVHGTEDKVTSFRASQQFHEGLPASDKTLSLNEGGYHELHNEPDGVKEKLFEECVRWIENHSRADQQRADRGKGAVEGSGTSEQAKL